MPIKADPALLMTDFGELLRWPHPTLDLAEAYRCGAIVYIALPVARTLVSPSASPAALQELVDSISMLHKDSYIKAIEALTMYAPVTDVSLIRVPVQIIVGADDKLTPPAISRKMAQADCMSGQASAAPEPSPRRRPKSSSGSACICASMS